jgi:hypothetical protein
MEQCKKEKEKEKEKRGSLKKLGQKGGGGAESKRKLRKMQIMGKSPKAINESGPAFWERPQSYLL